MVGISVAAKREWEYILKYFNMDNEKLNFYPFGEYFTTLLNGENVFFYRTGARKVNSSGATQYMIDKLNLSKVIVIGTCAGINDKYKPLDIFIPNIAVQYDATVKEMEPLIKESFVVNLSKPNIDLIYNTGIIGTADKAVVYWPDYLMLKENKIDIADTESAAIAYICKCNNIDCIIIKGISDFPHEVNDEQTYNKQLDTFIENIPKIMENILDNYLKYFIK